MRAFIFTGVLCLVTFGLASQSNQPLDLPLPAPSDDNQELYTTYSDLLMSSRLLHLDKGREMVESWAEFSYSGSGVNPVSFPLRMLQIRLLRLNGRTTEALTEAESLIRHHRKFALTPNEKFELNNLAAQLYLENHKPSSALRLFSEAHQEQLPSQPGPQVRMKLYDDITMCYLVKGAVKKGIRACNRFIEEVRRDHDDISLTELSLQNKKAQLYQKGGKHQKAIAGFEDIVDMYPRFVAESDPVFVNLLSSLAKAYRSNHDEHHAYVYLRWAYEKLHEQRSPDPEQILDVIKNLTEISVVKGDDVAAQHYLNQARILSARR